MDTIIVGIIVAGAVFFTIRTIVSTLQGKKRCGCSEECSCTREKASSCDMNTSRAHKLIGT